MDNQELINLSLFINDDVLINDVNLRYCNRSNKVKIYTDNVYVASIGPSEYKIEFSNHYKDINTYIYKLVKRV
ncbi:hypothetical protein [Clostridium sp.]|uniref:hypothetical protein n=1 Tax=Clostridium sp. TaxID=1506 RepID=UPI002630AF5C|nr:hypothetical protein [Clostridium sp.]